eukprot:1157316-Pelagomonas_calceolata.AAC.5
MLFIFKGSWGEFAGWVAVENGRRRIRTSRSMADNPPDPHLLCFWLSPRLAVSGVDMHADPNLVLGQTSKTVSPTNKHGNSEQQNCGYSSKGAMQV